MCQRYIAGAIRSLLTLPVNRYRINRLHKATRKNLPSDLNKLLIISAPRSGSNFLCGLLNSHPQIVCFHELFHRYDIYYGPKNRRYYDFGSIHARDANPIKFLSEVYSFDHGAKAVGFKIFTGHNDRVLSALIRNRHVKKIVLHRQSALHAYSSRLIARKTAQYQALSEKPDNNRDATSIRVSVDNFIGYVERINKRTQRILSMLSGQDFLSLQYADIVSQPTTIRATLQFIGVDQSVNLIPIHKKQNPTGLQDRIENFDEICTELSGTKYECYLEEEFSRL